MTQKQLIQEREDGVVGMKPHIECNAFYTERSFTILPEISFYWDEFCYSLNFAWLKWAVTIELVQERNDL